MRKMTAWCVAFMFVLSLTTWAIAKEDGGGKAKTQAIGGTISKVDGSSITIDTPAGKGGTAAGSKTLAIDSNTKIMVPTGETEEVEGKNGNKIVRPKMAEGKVSDLKKGDRVTVSYTGDKAVQIALAPAAAKKAGNDAGGGKAKTQTVSGTISKVDGSSITIDTPAGKGGSAAGSKTLAIDSNTKIMVPTGETEEVDGKNGNKIVRPKMVEGKVSDLKTGDRVTANYTGDKAVQIALAPAAAKKGK